MHGGLGWSLSSALLSSALDNSYQGPDWLPLLRDYAAPPAGHCAQALAFFATVEKVEERVALLRCHCCVEQGDSVCEGKDTRTWAGGPGWVVARAQRLRRY